MAADLGTYGVFQSRFHNAVGPDFAAGVEALGYCALWIGASPPGDLVAVERLLDATNHITVATDIVNIWTDDAATVAASYHRIAARHPDRFLLGVGVGHPEMVHEYDKPYANLVSYLDALDTAGVPAKRRLLAALGPKVLRLSAERAAGALPYLTTPEHTGRAREILGTTRLLAPAQLVVVDSDEARARETARATIKPYLGLSNYANNLRRLGWADDDLAGGGSDRLVEALAIMGGARTVASRLNEHVDAGADHVAVLAIATDDDLLTSYRALAELIF